MNALIDFAKQTFGAEETARTSHHGEIHANVRLGDSMVFIGGGAPELSVTVTDRPMALHVYVEDTDAAYERGLKAGGVSLGEPVDHPYGERGAGVKDQAGNYWYIATYKGARYIPEGMHTVTPYLHPRRAELASLACRLYSLRFRRKKRAISEPRARRRNASPSAGAPYASR